MLYHGSDREIKGFIEPFPSRVLKGEKAVFASRYKEFVLAFMGDRWNDSEIELGSFRFQTYMIERKPGIFKKKFHKKKGFLYELSDRGFKHDDILGMQQFELIKKTRCRIKKTVVIDDVLKELKRSKIVMIRYSQLRFIYLNSNRKDCNTVKFDSFGFDDLESLPLKNVCIKSRKMDYASIRDALYGPMRKKIQKIGVVNLTVGQPVRLYLLWDKN